MTSTLPRSFSLAVLLHAALAGFVVLFLIQNAARPLAPSTAPLVLFVGESENTPTSAPAGPPAVSFRPPPPSQHGSAVPTADPAAGVATSADASPLTETRPPRPKPDGAKPPRMTIDQFNALHPTGPEPRSHAAPTTPVRHLGESYPLPAPGATNSAVGHIATDTAEPLFAAGLRRALAAALAATAAHTGGSAEVEFRLGRDGSLIAARIIRSSGDPAFDAALLAVYRQVRARGFTPAEIGLTYSLTFRASDE